MEQDSIKTIEIDDEIKFNLNVENGNVWIAVDGEASEFNYYCNEPDIDKDKAIEIISFLQEAFDLKETY